MCALCMIGFDGEILAALVIRCRFYSKQSRAYEQSEWGLVDYPRKEI